MEYTEDNIQHLIWQHTSQAHNSIQLFHGLKNSSTEAAHLKIVADSDKHMERETTVGELLLKLTMHKEVINTRATATYLRENFSYLDT